MTDARPEPDNTGDDESGARPEPVWARPAAPDPWAAPRGSSPVADPEPAVEPAAPGPETVPVPAGAHEIAPEPDEARPDASPLDGPQPQGPQYEAPQYEALQHEEPRYDAGPPPPVAPAPPVPPAGYSSTGQFAQYAPPSPYTAPQGFGSPRGPAEESGAAEVAPATASSPWASGRPDAAGQPGRAGSPWYVDADQPDGAHQPDQPGQVGQPGQPGQAQPGLQPGGPGWQPPYAVAGTSRRKRSRGALIALLIGACLLAGVLGGVAGNALQDSLTDASGRNPTISLPEPEPVDAGRTAAAVTTVADKVLPSVVSINVTAGQEEGTGSGFVIDSENGYILTNNHVVTAGGTAAATDIEVIFQDGTQVDGKVVGTDDSYDLAVVKVTARGLRELVLGDSDKVRVGDPVVAIGAPLGLTGTVTTGIVSALNRPVAAGEGNKPAFINAIQTDAAINPGNSGGPLVDAAGNVIAVNSAIARAPGSLGSSSGNIGLGFAIPSNQARRTADQLIRTGKASHPIIGVSLDSTYEGRGVKVAAEASSAGVAPVTANGPADQAGIKAGEVILKINDRVVTEPDELIVAIRAKAPGETITLTLLRGGRETEVRVKLSASTD